MAILIIIILILLFIKFEHIIKEIFADESYLGVKKFKKEYEENHHQCTICLEGSKIDIDDVSLTPYNHLFHYNCLFEYEQKTHNAKCPNCSYNFIENYKKRKEKEKENKLSK